VGRRMGVWVGHPSGSRQMAAECGHYALTMALIRAFSVAPAALRRAATFSPTAVVLARNQDLLDAVAAMNWGAYSAMCDPSLSCFEHESRSHFVTGLDFHKIYYDAAGVHPGSNRLKRATMASPHVRFVGKSCAVLSYVRLVQTVELATGAATTARAEETRIWERQGPAQVGARSLEGEKARWMHVHFHRSQWD
jgi:hypothetical protein